MIRRAPSKQHEYVVLFFPKGWKLAVGVLTIFCQHWFFTMRGMVITSGNESDRLVVYRNRTAVTTEDSGPLLVYASLSFNSTVPCSCLENRQALMPLYEGPIRVYLVCLALIVSRKVSTWRARPAFLPGRNV